MADVSHPTSSEATSKPAENLTAADGKDNAAVTNAAAKNEESGETKPIDEGKDPNALAPADAPSEDKAKETEDASTPAKAVVETAPVTAHESVVNGSAEPTTPATAKKTNGSNSTKKKSGGIPEHKSKKLNKKKSKAELHINCQPGELFLARMKGHAPWPSIVCDEEILPESLLNSRPVTTALPDGTFKRADYAPGGKRQGERTYPVMFLYTNEFAWLPNTDLTPITPEDCKNAEEKGKSKSLISAYGVAAEGHDLQYFKTMLADHQAAIQEDLDLQNEKEAEKAAAKAAKAETKKARRKSAAAPQEGDEDEMDVDGEPSAEKPKSKKRKKAADTEEDADEKPPKTPKLKLNGPKTPVADKKSASKPKSSSKKAVVQKDSDEEMEDASTIEATPLSAAEVREKKDKEIRYYRHKLQRGLLSRPDVPSDEEVANASGYLGKLETYPALEGEIIRSTKIHKVLRAMIRLPVIPKDEVYNMKKRCSELLQKWHHILGNDSTGEGGADGANDADHKDGESAAETSTAPAPEIKSEEKSSTTDATAKVNGTANTSVKDTTPEEPKTDKSVPEKTTTVEKTDQPEVAKTTEEPEKSAEKPSEVSA